MIRYALAVVAALPSLAGAQECPTLPDMQRCLLGSAALEKRIGSLQAVITAMVADQEATHSQLVQANRDLALGRATARVVEERDQRLRDAVMKCGATDPHPMPCIFQVLYPPVAQ